MTLPSADEAGVASDRAGAAAGRVTSVDVLRGLVMVVMVLDHVREYFMDAKVDPTDLTSASPALFFTRWVTHFCAPTFVFLAGVSAALSGARRTRGELSRHLLVRGLWLIALEQVWGNVFIFFIVPQVALGLILWVIGWSMIVMAGLVYLPRPVIGGVGVAMIALHNLLDGVRFGGGGPLALLWGVLHQPGMQRLPGGVLLLIGYPLIPWVGVMAAGYALGPVFVRPTESRRPILLGLGLAMVAGFVAIRMLNAYGDPRTWTPGADPVRSLMSFLNCQKYPPSLLFLMMTLGPALLALAALDRGHRRWEGPLRTFGQVPLFFYLLQWPIAHGLAVAVQAARGGPIDWMFRFPPFQAPDGYGHGLPTVYLFWVITVALLYGPSRWLASLKRRRRDSWLSYL